MVFNDIENNSLLLNNIIQNMFFKGGCLTICTEMNV